MHHLWMPMRRYTQIWAISSIFCRLNSSKQLWFRLRMPLFPILLHGKSSWGSLVWFYWWSRHRELLGRNFGRTKHRRRFSVHRFVCNRHINYHSQSCFFSSGWVNCLDESMSFWTNQWTCPGWMFVPRKPHPMGNEYHSMCCGLSGIMNSIELVEGKDRQTTATTAWKNIWNTVSQSAYWCIWPNQSTTLAGWSLWSAGSPVSP